MCLHVVDTCVGVTLALEPPRARFLLSVATRHFALPPSTAAATLRPAELSSKGPDAASNGGSSSGSASDSGSGGGDGASESVRSLAAALLVNLALSLPPLGPNASSSSGLNLNDLYSSVRAHAREPIALASMHVFIFNHVFGFGMDSCVQQMLSAAFRGLSKEKDSVVAARRARAGTTSLRRSGTKAASLSKSLR